MNSELLNLLLFVYAIAKVLLLTGLVFGGAIVVIAECCGLRVVALGIEKVFVQVRGGQLADPVWATGASVLPATSSPRKVRCA